MNSLFRLALLFFCLICISKFSEGVGAGLNVARFFEQKCPSSEFITKDFTNWIADRKVKTLYFPMLTKLDASRITQSLFETNDLGFMNARDLQNSCMHVFPKGADFEFHGYCNKTFTKSFTVDEPKVLSAPTSFPGGESSTLHIALSDNKSWQVVFVCWKESNQRSFAVLSSKPTLSACDRDTITKFVKANGFHPRFFFGINYKHCAEMCPHVKRVEVPSNITGKAFPEFM